MLKIALIGISALESYALCRLFEESGIVAAENFSGFDKFCSVDDRFDLYVATPGCILSNIEFFLPKKSRTLVIGEESVAGNSSFISISKYTDLSEIQSSVETLIRGAEGKEMTGELSAREIEVLKELVAGKTHKEVADALCISVNTVVTHRKNITTKLGIRSLSGLSLYALMNGLV